MMLGNVSRPLIVQLVTATGLFLVAAVYLNAALGFSFGSWSSPKAGFLPTSVGALATVLAAINLMTVVVRRTAQTELGQAPIRAGLVTVMLAAYVPLLAVAGYLPATFLVLVGLLKSFGAARWPVILAVAAISTGATFYLFESLLSLPLP